MKKILIILILVGIFLCIVAFFQPEEPWAKKFLAFWQKMGDWFTKNIWSKIQSWLKTEAEPRVEEEVEKRKPTIEEEFKKEKEEIKEDVPRVTKLFQEYWEKLKALVQ